MQRNTPETPRNPRRTAEHDATQAMGGQPRSDEEDDALQEPDRVPSFLTARELQVPEGKPQAETAPKGRVVRPGGDDDEEA